MSPLITTKYITSNYKRISIQNYVLIASADIQAPFSVLPTNEIVLKIILLLYTLLK